MLTAQSKSSIKLEWAAVKDAETYSIYRSDSLNGKYSRIGMVLNPTFTDTALTASTGYYYKISAENECGEGAMSNPKSETTHTCPTSAAPQNVSAQALSSTNIKVSWSKVSANAESYTVYHSTSEGGTYDSIANTADTVFPHTGLSSASTHYYKIAGRNNTCGAGAASGSVSATTEACTKPAKPTNSTAAQLSPTSIRLSWDGIPNAAFYKIYRALSREETYQLIDTTAEIPYTNTKLSPATTYYYKIAAVNDCGESDQSEYASASTPTCPPPAAPTNVSAEAQSSTKISISWDEVNTAVSYKVYRSATSTGTYSPVGSTSGKSSTTWEDEGLNPATTYYYKVTAESECMESAQSSSYGLATTDCVNAPGVAPTNIKAEALSQNDVKVSWDAVEGMPITYNYRVYESESQNGVYIYSGSTTGAFTTITVTGLEPSKTHYFRVSVQNNCGESERSTSYASAKTEDCDLPTLSDPTGLSASTLSSRSVDISWDAVVGAAYYWVYRGTQRNSTYQGIGRVENNHFTDTTASSSTTYYYGVKALNACGADNDENLGDIVEVTTLCETPIPTNVSAAAKSSSSIEITWDVVPNAVSYSVYRSSTATGAYTLIEESKTASNSFTNTGLSSLTTYHYRVKAKTALCDESQMSVSVPGTTQ
jgi:fibronectin type 3 domain-containing protein